MEDKMAPLGALGIMGDSPFDVTYVFIAQLVLSVHTFAVLSAFAGSWREERASLNS